MRLRSRSGFTILELFLIGAVLVLLIGMVVLYNKVNAVDDRVSVVDGRVTQVDDRGRELAKWAKDTDPDGTAHNMPEPAGLTSYLIELSKKLSKHMAQKADGHGGPAHSGVTDNHLDPPPPPNWD